MSATSADIQSSSSGDMTGANRTRVLIADDHPLILAGIRRALDRRDGVEVVGEATSGPQVLAMVERRRPEVVLLDLYMPGMNGADLIAEIRRQWPSVKTVVLSANEDRTSIDSALIWPLKSIASAL